MISVKLLKKNIKDWFNNHLNFFQENRIADILYDNKEDWLSCYPNGTGLMIKRIIALDYVKQVLNGSYSLSDRIGEKLVSGGDTQMVLHTIKLKYSAGISPSLKLNHLIAANKVNMSYILRQVYMTSSCYILAFNEINFRGKTHEITILNNKEIIRIIYSVFRIHYRKNSVRDFLIILYTKLGEINARYVAKKTVLKPNVLKLFEWFIHV